MLFYNKVAHCKFYCWRFFWALWQSAGIKRGAVIPHSRCVKFAYLSAVFSNTRSLEFLVGRSGRHLTFSVPYWALYDSVPHVTEEFTESDWQFQRWQAPSADYFRTDINTALRSTCIYPAAKLGVLAAPSSGLPHWSLLALPGLPALLGLDPNGHQTTVLGSTCLRAGSRSCPEHQLFLKPHLAFPRCTIQFHKLLTFLYYGSIASSKYNTSLSLIK